MKTTILEQEIIKDMTDNEVREGMMKNKEAVHMIEAPIDATSQTRICLRLDFLPYLHLSTGQVERSIADVKTISLGVHSNYKPGLGVGGRWTSDSLHCWRVQEDCCSNACRAGACRW